MYLTGQQLVIICLSVYPQVFLRWPRLLKSAPVAMPGENKHVRFACSGPTVHDLRRPGAGGFRWRFSVGTAEVGKGFGSAGLSEREKIEGLHAGESPGCDCGFVVLDKHKQGKISSQVNNPICYKQPSLSPWQRGTDAEESPHIPWWGGCQRYPGVAEHDILFGNVQTCTSHPLISCSRDM